MKKMSKGLKIVFVSLIGSIIILLIGVVIYLVTLSEQAKSLVINDHQQVVQGRKEQELVNNAILVIQNKEQEENFNNIQDNSSKLESIDKFWNQYTNYKQGFTIKIPKKTKGYHDYHNVNVVEDRGIVYFILREGMVKYVDEAQKEKDIYNKRRWVSSVVMVQKVDNQEGLRKYIKNLHGSGCEIGEMRMSNQEGVFDVEIDPGEMVEPGLSTCSAGYSANRVKYYPTKNIVAYLNLGNDPTYAMGNNEKKEANGMIIYNSFKLLK